MHGTESVTLADFNPIIVLMSFLISALGSGVGLSAASRARRRSGNAAWWWLGSSAVAIGGGGIWSMHFIGMLAYDAQMRFVLNIPLTLISLVVGVMATLVGLTFAIRVTGPVRFIAGGVLTGLGVCGMHYMGMYAMDMEATMSWSPVLVAASVALAVGAATLALYFALTLENHWPMALAAVVMGVGICAMHYTGMLALRLTPTNHDVTTLSGLDPYSLALPIFGIAALVITVIFAGLFADAGQDDRLPVRPERTSAPTARPDPYSRQAPSPSRELPTRPHRPDRPR